MTVRAPVGYLAMANMDAVIGRGVAAIDGNKYLYYLLQTKWSPVNKIDNLNRDFFVLCHD